MDETESTELARRFPLDAGSWSLSRLRLRARSASFLANSSSATPFLTRQVSYNGDAGKPSGLSHFLVGSSSASLVSLGASLGLSSCCVLEGRALYGRS